jgi:hypothetical protein
MTMHAVSSTAGRVRDEHFNRFMMQVLEPQEEAASLELALCPAPDPEALRWKKKTFRNSYTWGYITDEGRAGVERVIAEDEIFIQAHPVKARRHPRKTETRS